MRTLIALVVIGLFAAGCATTELYHWGEYEEEVYLMYKAPDKATAERQIEALKLDIEKARSKDKPLPPGFHAHLGFLYSQTGQLDLARIEFETEKASFPESTKLMDRFLSTLK